MSASQETSRRFWTIETDHYELIVVDGGKTESLTAICDEKVGGYIAFTTDPVIARQIAETLEIAALEGMWS